MTCMFGFECDNNTCIDNSRRCDGNVDCIDGNDESHCGKYTLFHLIEF